MKLNLGCGSDTRSNYLNVDFRDIPGVQRVDLSKFPWPFADSSADEILMLDFLEHFPYSQTDRILDECWRVLRQNGKLVVQVPDLEHCAKAASMLGPFNCNRCGWEFPVIDFRADFFTCKQCKQDWVSIAEAAVHRLYGGQDYVGNWHQTGFSNLLLNMTLQAHGFGEIQDLEIEHQRSNWNIKMEAKKVSDDLWSDW